MTSQGPTIALIGTCDTKLTELLYARDQILHIDPSSKVILIDVGRTPASHPSITITQEEILAKYDRSDEASDSSSPTSPRHGPSHRRSSVEDLPRGEVIKHMILCATNCIRELFHRGDISAILSLGGSGNSSLAAAVMRDALPVGFPKLLVSTMASGDVRPYVGEVDICMMHSVVDVAGSNEILREVTSNAAAAVVGMGRRWMEHVSRSQNGHQEAPAASKADAKKKRVAITMFGVTTPCVEHARAILESQHACEVYIFHATGAGGRAMERLVREGRLDGVLDLTTTEVCDHLVGGILSAGEARLDAAARRGLPQVVSVGACDMVNFGPRASVPARFADAGRTLYEHNPSITLMRTTREEAAAVGAFIARKLRGASRPGLVEVWMPTGGISMIATPGGPFEDREADEALFRAVEEGLKGTGVRVVRDHRQVNDEGFAEEVVGRLVELMGRMND